MPVVKLDGQPFESDSRGGPPDNGGMEARVAALEAAAKTLATREDLSIKIADLRVEMHREFNSQSWRIIGAMITFGSVLTAVVYYIARNVH